jgi:hypothetical protein
MFVRFRQTTRRLQVSLVETHRCNGKVRADHIASLGSILTPADIADRIAFWAKLHQRLARLSNRISAKQHGELLASIHERVPMVTVAEQRDLQLANAKADAQFWNSFAALHAGTADDHRRLAAGAERAVTSSEAGRAQAAEYAASAEDRIAKIERGEDVQGGFGKPATREDFERVLIEAGMSKRDIQRAVQVSAISDAFGFDVLMRELRQAKDRAEDKVVRSLAGLLPDDG